MRSNRWSSQLSTPVAYTIRDVWATGAHTPQAPQWTPAAVIAATGAACREAGITGSPALVMRAAAAVNTYAQLFLPWAWTLADPEPDADERVLRWLTTDDEVTDVVWAEAWDEPLPASALLAEWPGQVRVLDLLRPFASRVYVNGRHTALVPAEVA